MNLFIIVTAFILSALGSYAVFALWKNKPAYSGFKHYLALVSSWCLILMAGFCWIKLKGAEYGMIYWLCILSFNFWYWVWRNRESKPRKHPTAKHRKKSAQHKKNQATPPLPHLLNWINATLLSALSSYVLSLSIMRLTPLQEVDQLVISAFMMILIWAFLSFALLISTRHWRDALLLISSTICLWLTLKI